MIIIQKTPYEIKLFHAAMSLYDSAENIQKEVQRLYAIDCFALEKKLEADGGRYSFHSDFLGTPLPSSVVLSSDRKNIIVNKNVSFYLRLYQLRAKDQSKAEDILSEPFFPGFRSSLLDIYGILKGHPYSASSDAYRFSPTHTPRIRQYIRKRFRVIFPDLFIGKAMIVDSFEEFYSMMHNLNSVQVRSLFRTEIHFVRLF